MSFCDTHSLDGDGLYPLHNLDVIDVHRDVAIYNQVRVVEGWRGVEWSQLQYINHNTYFLFFHKFIISIHQLKTKQQNTSQQTLF